MLDHVFYILITHTYIKPLNTNHDINLLHYNPWLSKHENEGSDYNNNNIIIIIIIIITHGYIILYLNFYCDEQKYIIESNILICSHFIVK